MDPTFFIAVVVLDRKMIEDLYMREIQLAAEKGLLMIITFNWEQFPRFFSCSTAGMYTFTFVHLTTVVSFYKNEMLSSVWVIHFISVKNW